MVRNVPVVATVFDFVEPLSDDERREFQRKQAEQWAKRTLVALLAYAEHDRLFARGLCKAVVDKFGPDDELASVFTKHLRVDRAGKSRGPRKTWNHGRY